jgi:uncharacterized protein
VTIELDVRDLVGRPGSSRAVHVAEPVAGLRTGLAVVPEDRAVDLDLLLESVVEGILASGPLEGVMTLQCARCLKPFEGSFRLDLREMFVPGTSTEVDEYPLVEGFVDVEPMIRDAVVLSMPLAPLCRQDCLGLCDRCGGDRNVGECRCPPEPDPRWSALHTLGVEWPTGPDDGIP